jgi:hypothetical protein
MASTSMLDPTTPGHGSPTRSLENDYHPPGSEMASAEVDAQLKEDLAVAMSSPAPIRHPRQRERHKDEEDGQSLAAASSAYYVVEKFRSERETPQGLEILVEWENYPRETDWTWEPEVSLKESVPEMIEEWHRARVGSVDLGVEIDRKEDFEMHEVERIIHYRRIKKIPHYLVSWKGYPERKDQTWERCDKLKIDVPTLVDEYECQRKRRRK